jgi:hypothetical protein
LVGKPEGKTTTKTEADGKIILNGSQGIKVGGWTLHSFLIFSIYCLRILSLKSWIVDGSRENYTSLVIGT